MVTIHGPVQQNHRERERDMKQLQMKKEMGRQSNKREEKEEYFASLLRHSFHVLSFSLLSLLLPFSFLLLARLSSSSIPSILPQSHRASALLRADMPVLRVLVTLVSVGATVHALTGRRLMPAAPVAWASLCAMQLCITVGMEANVAARVRVISSGAGEHVAWIKHAILFVGLYRTMRFWGKTVVKPVVDDAVFGGELEEEKSDKLVVCVAFTAFWMYLLQDEVVPMAFGAVERGLVEGMDWDGYVRWLVSHATVATGIVRIIQGLMSLGRLLLWSDGEEEEEEDGDHRSMASVDEKV